jgi:hypothetical protein
MSGDPRKFPFDKYSASIGEQNDFDNTLPFKFNIKNHLVGFELTSESGGDQTAMITLDRTCYRLAIPVCESVPQHASLRYD